MRPFEDGQGKFDKVVGGVETDGDMSQATCETVINLEGHRFIGLEVAWSGTPTGTLAVAASNTGDNWNDLTFSPAPSAPAGSAGSNFYNVVDLQAKKLRVKYTRTSGSGTLTVKYVKKGG